MPESWSCNNHLFNIIIIIHVSRVKIEAGGEGGQTAGGEVLEEKWWEHGNGQNEAIMTLTPSPQIEKKFVSGGRGLAQVELSQDSWICLMFSLQNSQTHCFPMFGGIQPAQKIKHHFGRSRRLESRPPKGWQCFIFKIQKWSNSLDFVEKSDFWNFEDFAKCMRDIWHVRWQALRFQICIQKPWGTFQIRLQIGLGRVGL